MRDFDTVSPLKILEGSAQGELGKGNLGVLMARAGLGKTSCLINFAFDTLLRGEKLAHVSLKDTPEKVASYYSVIFDDLITALSIEDEAEVRAAVDRNRIILAYLRDSFALTRLRENLTNMAREIDFVPHTLIVDGIDFSLSERDLFEGFKAIATEFHTEIWFSALTHRHLSEVNERGIPFPCSNVDDLFSIILWLYPTESRVVLRLLKDHERDRVPDTEMGLDPDNFLAIEG
jgi:hypothetical protein